MPRKWEYYKPGETVAKAGIKILKQRVLGTTQRDTTYRVKRLCPCGEVTVLTHRAILKRVAHSHTRCVSCGHAQAALSLKRDQENAEEKPRRVRDQQDRDYPPLKIPLPTWSVPGSD